MAESTFMYGVVAGVFAFLVGLLFATRGARSRRGNEVAAEAETTHSGGGGGGGEERRVKRFKSDGTPVYD
ncbi:hypothetical protein [Nitrososphaera sp.]|uniref:hypothetical protein n=1 Tax=Nitrososphaera sp. TaxID=1971748 RepID=UPI00307CE498